MTCKCTTSSLKNTFFLVKSREKEEKETPLTKITSTKNQIAVVLDSISMIWLEKQIVLLLGPKGVIKPRKIISKEQNHLFFQNYLSCSLSYGCKLHKSNFMHNLEHSISIFIKMDFANFTCANTCIKVYCRVL